MTRFRIRAALTTLALSLLAVLAPSTTFAATDRCAVSVEPAGGTVNDVYRITVSDLPVDPDDFLEVRLDVRRLGSRAAWTFVVFVVPGASEFYVDFNQGVNDPDEPPAEPLLPGRYLVDASTPHLAGACYAVGKFMISAG
jgi:hypothetical protein